MKLSYLPIIILLFFASCSSVSRMTIDVMQPAKVTISPSNRSVVIYDRISNKGMENTFNYINLQEKQKEFNIKTDSVPIQLISDFIARIGDTGYFMSAGSITNPEKSSSQTNLDVETLSKIREESGAKTVVSFDKIQLSGIIKDSFFFDRIYRTTFDLSLKSEINIYLPDETTPHTLHLSDSLFWEGYDVSPELAITHLPLLSDCVYDAVNNASSRFIEQLMPHQTKADRLLFSTINAPMKDAMDYWKKDRRDEAAYLWEYVYETSKNSTLRAKAAHNLALYYELQNDFTKSLDWAATSMYLFLKSPRKNIENMAWVDNYIDQLLVRKANDQNLRFQML